MLKRPRAEAATSARANSINHEHQPDDQNMSLEPLPVNPSPAVRLRHEPQQAGASDTTSRFGKFNAFVDHGQAHLAKLGCSSAARLWFTIWGFEYSKTNSACVSIRELAQCFGAPPQSISKRIQELRDHGYLKILEAGDRLKHTSAVYRLLACPERVAAGQEAVITTTTALLLPQEEAIIATMTELSSPGQEAIIATMTELSSPGQEAIIATMTFQKKTEKTEEEQIQSPAADAGGGGGSQPSKQAGTKRKTKQPAKATNPNHRPAVEAFCAAWKERYGQDYYFQGGKDAKAVTTLLTAVKNDLDALKAVFERYLDDNDSLAKKNRHSLGILISKINNWLTPRQSPHEEIMARVARGNRKLEEQKTRIATLAGVKIVDTSASRQPISQAPEPTTQPPEEQFAPQPPPRTAANDKHIRAEVSGLLGAYIGRLCPDPAPDEEAERFEEGDDRPHRLTRP